MDPAPSPLASATIPVVEDNEQLCLFLDNLASVTDLNGNTTSYRYDDFHRQDLMSSRGRHRLLLVR